MKRGKDEDKIMGPMFPRLHVNDADKGGPRAPPRNKMALYEQLSIPSQRFNHAAPQLSQGSGNEKGMFSHRLSTSGKQFSQYSDLSTPLIQAEVRKKSDEDDVRVPIFIQSVPSEECGRYTNKMDRDSLSSHSPSHFQQILKFEKAKNMLVLEHSMRQEGKCQSEENSEEFPASHIKAISSSHASGKLGFAVSGQNMESLDKRNSSASLRASQPVDQNIVDDDTETRQSGSCRLMQMEILDSGDSLSESSVVDSIFGLDMTPDDVVGIIGQKHFWKARRAIVNQQRVFAVQVFELHRLIKVQRLIAASPHLLFEDSAYLSKPMKALPGNIPSLDCPVKAISIVSKQKGRSEKPGEEDETSAIDVIGKASFSTTPNGVPSTLKPPMSSNSPAPSASIDQNIRPWCFNHLQGHQWLIPVMSPSEGLVYKPYPGPGFVDPACGGCGPPGSNPVISNFLTPAYGVPAPHPPPYQLPSCPSAGGSHGYFPPYGMPVMNPAAFSGSFIEQINASTIPGQFSSAEANFRSGHHKLPTTPSQRNHTLPDDIEVQDSTASSPSLRLQSSRASSTMEGKNVLPLFPTSPVSEAPDSNPQALEPEPHARVIKVVPHSARSATESAARIFQSIQEERKQNDSS